MKKIAAIFTAVLAAACSSGIQPPPAKPDAQLPSQILDLTNWTLTTPLPSAETGALEIPQPELGKYRNDLFRVSDSKNAVLFITPGSGAVQNGAEYPRNELREVLPNGASAQWAATQGTHTFTVTASIDTLSKSKTMVVGQVHAIGPYILLIQMNNKKLFVKAGDQIIAVLNDNYELGTIFKYQFVVSGGEIKVFYNDGKEPAATWKTDCARCYFKAGSYLQSLPDPSDPTAGQVSIYSMTVNHQ